jgi:hypothetical protein
MPVHSKAVINPAAIAIHSRIEAARPVRGLGIRRRASSIMGAPPRMRSDIWADKRRQPTRE